MSKTTSGPSGYYVALGGKNPGITHNKRVFVAFASQEPFPIVVKCPNKAAAKHVDALQAVIQAIESAGGNSKDMAKRAITSEQLYALRFDANGGKFYAVACGSEVGIYYRYSDCDAFITGFNNPRFQSFTDFNEAIAFMILKGYHRQYKDLLNGIESEGLNVNNLIQPLGQLSFEHIPTSPTRGGSTSRRAPIVSPQASPSKQRMPNYPNPRSPTSQFKGSVPNSPSRTLSPQSGQHRAIHSHTRSLAGIVNTHYGPQAPTSSEEQAQLPPFAPLASHYLESHGYLLAAQITIFEAYTDAEDDEEAFIYALQIHGAAEKEMRYLWSLLKADGF